LNQHVTEDEGKTVKKRGTKQKKGQNRLTLHNLRSTYTKGRGKNNGRTIFFRKREVREAIPKIPPGFPKQAGPYARTLGSVYLGKQGSKGS